MADCSFHIESSNGERRLLFNCVDCREQGDLSSGKCLRNTLEVLSGNKVNQMQYRKRYYRRIYYAEQLEMLYEFLDIVKELKSGELWNTICSCSRHREWRVFLRNLVEKEAVRNPVRAYEMLYSLREQYTEEHVVNRHPKSCVESYVRVITALLNRFEDAALIKKCLEGREIPEVVESVLQPSFISSSIGREPPEGSELLDKYVVADSEVRILERGTERVYFIKPSELSLSFNEVRILHELKDMVSEKYVFELIDPLEARSYFMRLGRELLSEFDGDIDRERLSRIFARYTAGYGILEILFCDEEISDIYVDSPTSLTPVYVEHETYGMCTTNVRLSGGDLDRISSKFRSIGGRPFDEANPVMDMELQDIGVRVTGVREPSTFDGIAFAFRKRRDRPWTLPMFVREGMMSAKSAAVLSYLVGGKCTILVTGARSSGKTSLLTALMSEIKRTDRIVLMEDTPEIPVNCFKKLGWKIGHLRNQPPLMRDMGGSYELSPEQNLRAALRLGEGVLILGEVRGLEARALFEAMRVGAAGNAVLGTIHGSTPYDTWDRVTNDLQVPSASFKAVDVVLSLGYREDLEGVRRRRYLVGITEVKKIWEKNPQTEDAFFDLMHLEGLAERFDFRGSELINKIAIQRSLSLDECMDNIGFREFMINESVELSGKQDLPRLLEIENVAEANSKYLSLINEADGAVNYSKLRRKWVGWLRGYADRLPDDK